MTGGLALCPVAEIVQSYHAVGAGHSNQRAEIDAEPLEPQRTVEARMDQPPVHADRMPKHSVIALVTMNSANALQENVRGPNTIATAVMLLSHNDLAGVHCTRPSSGSVFLSTKIRSEPGCRLIPSPEVVPQGGTERAHRCQSIALSIATIFLIS